MDFNSFQTTQVTTPNTVKTQSISKLLFLLSRGKIEGFVNTSDPLADLYFGNTPVSAGGGTYNINNVSVAFRDGSTGQSYIEGFEDVATAYNLGTKVLQATPEIYTATTSDVDAIRVTLRFPALFKQGDKGETQATPLEYKIYARLGAGAWELVHTVTLNQPSTVTFDKDYLVDKPRTGTGSFAVKVERVTADNSDLKIQNDLYLQIVNEIKYVKLAYDGFALLAVKTAALGSNINIPVLSPHLKGVHCLIPSNYVVATRSWTGGRSSWDGLFKPVREWTNNPALILYTVLVDVNFGLGDIIDPADIDQYSFGEAAEYCDGSVDALDESGNISGTEPRFQFNYQFMGHASVYEFIQNIASTFSAVVVTNGNYIRCIQDRPTPVTRQFTPSNVENGLFNYSTVNADDIINACTVWWNNPAENSLSVPEYYQDDAAVTRYGTLRLKEITGIGVTTQGQARRLARNIVETAISNTDIVNFKCGYNNAFIEVGEVVEIMDPYWAEVQQDAVLISKTSGTLTLDRAVTVTSGDTFDVPGTSGTLETRTITSTGTLTTINFSGGAISALAGAVVVVTGGVSPRQFRVSDVSEDTPGINKITAIFFDPNKFARIDNTTPGPELNYRAQPDGYTVSPVSAIVFDEESLMTPEGVVQRWLTARWSPVANQLVTSYKVFGSIDGGELVDLGVLTQPFIRAQVSVSGTYKVVVYAMNARGKLSMPTVGTYVLDLDTPIVLSDLLDVTDLFVKGTSGVDFTGRDLTVSWADANVSNEGPVQKGYVIRVKDSVTPTTIYRQEFILVGTTEYTYDYTKQLADNPLDPKREVIIEVKVQDTFNRLTAGTSATFTNAAPAVPTGIVLSPNPEGASISLDPCTEFDYQNTVIWASLTTGFTPDVTNRIDITTSSFLNYFNLPSSTPYYVRIAHTDSFTSDTDRETGANLNVSAEQTVTTGSTTGSMNTAMFAAYKRSATLPTDDPGNVTFTFGTGITTPATDALANGWYKTIPTADGNPLYGVGATAAGIGTTDTVLAAEWSDPIVLLNDGLDGVSAATVYLYQRTATSTPPSITGTSPANDMTYTFATGVLSGTPPTGWDVTIPTSGGDYLWVTRATAVAAASVLTDVIDYTQWSAAESFAVNGTDGADAPLLTISGTGFAFVFENENATTSSSPTLSFDAVLQNITGTVTWTVTAYNDAGSSLGTLTLGGSGNTGRTLTSANFNSLGALTTQYVIVNATLGALSDSMTVYRGDGGSTLVQSVLSNEAHTFQASNTGVVGSYTGSGTEIRTYQGITELTYDGVGTANGTWKVVAAATNITTGTLTDSGTYLTVGNHSAMTANQASIDYTISGKDLQGVAFSCVKRQSFAKSNAGAPSGWITVKSNAGSVFLLNSSGTAATPSSIILSRTLGDGVTDTLAAGTDWTVTNGTFTGSLTVINSSTGAFASIEPSEMTTDSVTFRCEVTDTVTGYEYSDEITVYKSSDAVSGYLTNDSVSLPASSSGVISSYTGASGTFQLVNSRGNITATGSNPVFSIIGHSGFGTTYPTNTGISISNVGAYSVTSNILTATTVATVTFRAAYTDPVTATVKNVDRIFTISKSNSGTAGTAGTTGNSARKVYALYTGNPVISGAAVTVTDPTIVPAANAWSPAAASNFSYTVPTPSTGQSVFTADGTYDPVAGQTTFQQPYLANFKVGSLEVVSNIVAGGIQVNNGGSVYSGKSTSTSTGTAGFFLGSESGTAKLTVGDANLRKALMWDGTNLNLRVDGTSGLKIINMASGSPVSLGGLYAQTVFSWPATVLASATGTGTVNRVALASTNTQGTGYGFLSASPVNTNSVEYSVSSPASGGTATIRGLNVTDTYIESTPASGSSNLRLQANGTSGALYISSSNITCNGNNTDFVIQSSTASGGQLRLKTGSGSSGYGVLFRQDGSDFYILRTASGSADGTWTTDRPFMYNFSSGGVTIEKLRINSMTVGTGAATATFTGTNKPGSNSSNTWLTLVINGTTYYIPAWT